MTIQKINHRIKNGFIYIEDEFAGMQTTLGIHPEQYKITFEQISSFLDSLSGHITAVREACAQIGVSDQQAKEHDRSKFSTEELPHYARNFFGDKANPDGFAGAWLNHIHHNPHHWQHWIFPDNFTPKGSSLENGVMEMPQQYALEMVADWMGASKQYTGSWDMADWLWKNWVAVRVHTKTRSFLREVLDGLGYADIVNIDKRAE